MSSGAIDNDGKKGPAFIGEKEGKNEVQLRGKIHTPVYVGGRTAPAGRTDWAREGLFSSAVERQKFRRRKWRFCQRPKTVRMSFGTKERGCLLAVWCEAFDLFGADYGLPFVPMQLVPCMNTF